MISDRVAPNAVVSLRPIEHAPSRQPRGRCILFGYPLHCKTIPNGSVLDIDSLLLMG